MIDFLVSYGAMIHDDIYPEIECASDSESEDDLYAKDDDSESTDDDSDS